jgi:tetratricopeptide (TPR) repeat protein
MRQVNTRFFFLLLIGTIVFAASLFGVHRLQAGSIASALLWHADQAEKNGKATLAARYLGQYLEFVPDDLNERVHLANVLSGAAVTPSARRRAEFAINQVLARDPDQHELRQALCRLAIAGRRIEAAEEQLAYLRTKLPESGAIAFLDGQFKELLLEVRAVGAKEQAELLTEARQAYSRAIAAEPKRVEAYVRLIAVLVRQDFGKQKSTNDEEIDRLVKAALENAPNDPTVLSLAADQAFDNGETAAALKYLDQARALKPSEPSIYLIHSRILNQQGERAKAIEQLRKGLEVVGKEHHFDLSWTLANLLLDDEQIDAARKIMVAMRGINQLSADYLDARCMMYQNRWADAARTLERLRPAFRSVTELALQVDLFLGACYQRTDDPTRALSRFRSALQLDPNSAPAQHGEATALAALGRRDEATDRFKNLLGAANAHPNDLKRWRLEYAQFVFASGAGADPQLAAKMRSALDEIEKEPGQAVECAILRSALSFAEKKYDQAQAELQQIIKTEPKRYEPWIALAEMAMEIKQGEQAEKVVEQAIANVEDTADFRLARIQFWSRYRAERTDKLDALEQDLARFPVKQQARVLETLADAHYRAGRLPQAVRLLRQLAALPPHLEDVRVRMLLFGLALAQDDEAEMQRVLGEVKKIEGEPATEWCYGEAQHLVWRARQRSTERKDRKDLFERARGLLTTAATRRPDWPSLFLARAEIDELDSRPEQAIANYRQALDLGSRDAHAVYQLLHLLSAAQRFEEAEQLIRKMDQAGGMGRVVGQSFVTKMVLEGQDQSSMMRLVPKVFSENSKNYREHMLHGQALAAGGRTSTEAENAFRRAVALEPRQPETWIALVRYLGTTGQFLRAVKEIENAGKQLEEDVKLPALAACYEVLGALDEAEAVHKKSVAQQPNSPRRLRAAAGFLLRFGKAREAEPLFRAVLDPKLDADEEERAGARRGLALALAQGGNPQRSVEALELVGLGLDAEGKLRPESLGATTDARLTQARVLAALGSNALRSQAIPLLEALHEKHALPVEDQFQLAHLLHRDNRGPAAWKKTRELLTSITTAQPYNARYIALAANLLLVHKEVADAEPLIGRLEQLERDRKVPAGMLGSVELRARSLEMRGKETQAISLLQNYAQQKDALPGRSLLLAGLHGRLGNFQEAVDLCEKVRDAGYAEDAYGTAIGLLRAGKPTASQKPKLQRWQEQVVRVEKSLRESVGKNEGNVMLRLQLQDLLELQGRYDEAQTACRDILQRDPDNLVALNNLAWMLAQQPGTGEEPLRLISRAIERYGARPELLDTRAAVYLSVGKYKEAIADVEHAIREAPTPARWFHLTRAHHRAKNAPQAIAALQRANDLGLNVQMLHPSDQQAYHELVPQLQK